LAKHVCGSCRFFEAARDGKNGWCTHPDRQESTSIRLLVRAAELRCRNDWGQDLWEAQVESDTVLGVVMNDSASPRPPRTDQVVNPPVERTPIEPSIPPDLTSMPLTPVARQSTELEPDEQARTVSANLDRELVRRARATFRERQQNKGYSLSQPAKVESEPLVISNQYIPPSRDPEGQTNRGVTNSVFEFPEAGNEDKFDAVPKVDAQQPLPESPRPTSRPSRQRVRSEFDMPGLDAPIEVEQASSDYHEPELEPVARSAERWPDLDDIADSVLEREERDAEAFIDNRDDAVDEDEWESWEPARGVERASAEPQGVWASIPRCCRTCRDFRPAGNGERGWCNNQWAFKHRRMVDADDRPCETSIGHWWLPGDEAWQGDYDVSAFGQPTPLMDRWFGRPAGSEPAAEAPVDRRRRKASSW
jgi:hypothetical protein